MGLRVECINVDTTDLEGTSAFWEQALGWRITERDRDEYLLEPPTGSRDLGVVPELLFARVSEGKQVKNRLHLDLRPDRDQAAEVARLEALGARRVDVGQGPNVSWVVMADPEGNEFCVLSAPAG